MRGHPKSECVAFSAQWLNVAVVLSSEAFAAAKVVGIDEIFHGASPACTRC
jgi:hypothetical protein